MIKFLRRTIFIGFLIISLTFNAAVVVSEAAYNIAYGLLSNAVSIIYETADLSSSIGWKKSKLHAEVATIKKQIETEQNLIKSLKNNEQKLLKDIQIKNSEVDKLIKKDKLQIATIEETRKEIKKLDNLLSDTSRRLKSSEGKLLQLSETNKALSKNLSKSSDEIALLTKKTASQVTELKATRKIIQETTDRASKRIAKRVARNIAAMPFESIPVAGIAITVGTIYLEIQDACTSLEEFNEMTNSLGLPNDGDAQDKSFCSVSKEDLLRLTSAQTNDFENCIVDNKLSQSSDIEDLMSCMPVSIEDLTLPKFDEFEAPSQAEL